MTHTHSDAATAAQAQRDALLIGWVAGTPIPRDRLDTRVQQLRAGRLAARLPAVGSKEDRQFLRWTAQVLLTEELCRVELARLEGESGARVDDEQPELAHTSTRAARAAAEEPEHADADPRAADAGSALPGADSSPRPAEAASAPVAVADQQQPRDRASALAAAPATTRPLTQAESLHLGSINAAAWSSTPAMSALYHLVTAPTPPAAPRSTATRTWYRVVHAVAATPLEAATAPEISLGWTTLDDLPATLAAELRVRPLGTRVGPVRSGLGWHFATVAATEVRAAQPAPQVAAADTADPTRLAAFNRWLDQRRRDLVGHAPGFEHPGDPGQPDNTHRH